MAKKREIKDCIFDLIKSNSAKEIINSADIFNDEGFDLWSFKKLVFLDYYLHPYLDIIKNNGFKAFFIDLFSSSGANEIKGGNHNKLASLGSPIISLLKGIKYIKSKDKINKFDKWFFIEKEEDYCKALKKRVSKTLDIVEKLHGRRVIQETDVRIICGNSNEKIDSIIEEIKKEEGKVAIFVFIDPYNFTNLEWLTWKKILSFKIVDIIFTFPVGPIRRGVRNCKIPENYLPPSLIELLKRKDITEVKEFSSLYAKDIVNETRRKIVHYKEGINVRNTNNAELYRIELFTNCESAHKICSAKASELNSLSPNNLKFIVDQVLGKQKGLSKWF